MSTYFISDLHLLESRPQATQAFTDFLDRIRDRAEALYILGDLFEVWVGDDDDAPFASSIRERLLQQSQSHPVAFVRGNRDFLIGERFSAETGVRVLDDETVIDLHGERTLLLHGDTLCTDDVGYQAFRRTCRNPAWQQQLLAQPLAARRAFAAQVRAASADAMSGKSEAIMDANLDAVREVMARHACTRLIHGHTHRPAVHEAQLAQVGGLRIVLGDWYEQGSVLVVDHNGADLQALRFTVSTSDSGLAG
jgi:UDP-2,3-diacylglucosamine hydrolase